MTGQLQRGQQVRVNAYGGKKPLVTVVEDRGDIILICKNGEFEEAIAENRAPVTIGLPKKDVLEVQ
jgi:hypothetical protein